MRNSILGTVAGLLVGSVGAIAYSHYLGDGGLLASMQAQLDTANSKLAQAQAAQRFLKEQNNSSSQQVDQLVASNEQLRKTLASGGDASAAGAAPTAPTSIFDPNLIRGIMGALRGGGPGGGFRSPEQRMLTMQTRLKLDPDQAKALKTAMDADDQARRDAFRQARQNHTQPDMQALAAASTLDKTLQSVLTPQQQQQYQQLQSDEKSARAEINATSQVDNMMPLLQLSDDQKEKLVNQVYQQQLSAPDPMTLIANPNALQVLTQQGQSTQSAMKQVLTPDQFALYQQSEQLQQQGFGGGGGGGNRRNANGGGGGGQNNGNGTGGAANGAVASATPSAQMSTPVPATTTATTPDPNASTASTSTTTASTSTTTSASTGTSTTSSGTTTTATANAAN